MIQPRVFVVSDRSIANLSHLTDLAYGSLIDLGSGPTGFSGQTQNLDTPINGRAFIKHFDKNFTLVKTVNTGAPNAITGGTQDGITPYQLRRFKIKVPTPQYLKYDASLDVWPTNSAPLLAIGFVNLVNTAEPLFVTPIMCVNWVVTMRYEDA